MAPELVGRAPAGSFQLDRSLGERSEPLLDHVAREISPVSIVTTLTDRLRGANSLVVDALIAITVASLAVVEMQGAAENEEGFRDSDGLGALLVLAQTLPLGLRRVAPIGSLAVITAAIGLHSALGYDQIQTGLFTSLFGVGSAAYLTDNRRALVALLLAAAGIGVFYTTTRVPQEDYGFIATSGVWLTGWIIGSSFRIRRRRAAAVERRAEVLEQDSEVRAREAVAEERARITRELHDIIGHTLNLIVVQAGAARAVFKSRPEQALESLDSIEITARHSLSDMERMLGILRPPEAQPAPYDPQPGLEQVDRLAEQFTDAGLPVEVNVAGEPHKLPTSLDLSAYRIVQEALTNALKHAGPARAWVAISYLADKLELDIVDDGQGSGDEGHSADGGRGLIGMRERVSLFGGELDAGPAAEGGFRVHAILPLEESR